MSDATTDFRGGLGDKARDKRRVNVGNLDDSDIIDSAQGVISRIHAAWGQNDLRITIGDRRTDAWCVSDSESGVPDSRIRQVEYSRRLEYCGGSCKIIGNLLRISILRVHHCGEEVKEFEAS
jgi:hypothetical protein